MTVDEFFGEFPIESPKELTHEDLIKVLEFSLKSVKIYKKEDISMTNREKIDSYKSYCKNQIANKFTNLTPEAKVELDKFFNLYGTHFILQHLLDE